MSWALFGAIVPSPNLLYFLLFCPGTAVIVMTTVDVDSTGASYYGEQALHHLSADGESSMVQLGKHHNY